jgi:hypothetical protein
MDHDDQCDEERAEEPVREFDHGDVFRPCSHPKTRTITVPNTQQTP